MADLNKLNLPVMNQTTGEVTYQEFDLPGGGSGGVSEVILSLQSDNGYVDGILQYRKFQKLMVDGVEKGIVNNSVNFKKTVTLSASQDTEVIFYDSMIGSDAAIDVYTSNSELEYKSITNSGNGYVTVTFEKQSSASSVTVQIYVRN